MLLYNFFEDSTLKSSQWRTVLNMVPPVENGTSRKTIPCFDPLLSGVCQDVSVCVVYLLVFNDPKPFTKLKFLYVAITRARKNLWFSDNSETCKPMRVISDSFALGSVPLREIIGLLDCQWVCRRVVGKLWERASSLGDGICTPRMG